MDYDLFAVAKRNLQGAVTDRPDDPYANFHRANKTNERGATT